MAIDGGQNGRFAHIPNENLHIATSAEQHVLCGRMPRDLSDAPLKSGNGHQGGKPARAIYLRDGRIFSTGFSKMAERQYAVWDENNLGTALTMEELDSSNGIQFPFYDEDTGLIFLCGKGDSTIRYFEYTSEAPYIHFLSTYSSSDPQRGMGMMSKRGLNIYACEIARFYKLLNSGLCEVISFTVPRKAELFQDDLYPDTAAEEHAITAEEWINGRDANPKLVPVRDLYTGPKSPATSSTGAVPSKTSNVEVSFTKTPLASRASAQNSGSDAPNKPQRAEEAPAVQLKRSPPPPAADTSNDKKHEEVMAMLETVMRRLDDLDRRVKVIESQSASKPAQESVVDSDETHDLQF